MPMIWRKKHGDDLMAKCGPLTAYVRFFEFDCWEWWLGGTMIMPHGMAPTRGKAMIAAEKAMKKIVDKMNKDLNAGKHILDNNKD